MFIVLLLVLLTLAELIYFSFSGESRSYFVSSADGKSLNLDKKAISATYKNFSDAPFSYSGGFTQKKAAGTYRVILLGEASLSGWPFLSEDAVEKGVSFNLQNYIPSEKTEVITVSIAGFNSFHLKEMTEELASCNPDMVIIYLGHNEFYGYKSAGKGISDLFIPGILSNIFNGNIDENKIAYDSKTDDFEMLLPLAAAEKFLDINSSEYKKVIESFSQNISFTARYLKEKKISLAFSMLADNYLLPPVGISNSSGGLSADIIFNNARMALLRDGNETAAEKLFLESKNIDSFRLRIPGDLTETLSANAREYGADLLRADKEFCRLSQNYFPADDLFLDYIHPNKKGLEIIAAVYSQYIISSVSGIKTNIDSLRANQHKMYTSVNKENNPLPDYRVRKSGEMLKKANLSGKLSRASF